jgi:hypothetical protein
MTESQASGFHTTPLLALPRETPTGTLPVLSEIAGERIAQLARGYTLEHDDHHGPEAWLALLIDHHVTADAQVGGSGVLLDPAEYRRRMLIIATLAVAAIEALDRAEAGLLLTSGAPLSPSVAVRGGAS